MTAREGVSRGGNRGEGCRLFRKAWRWPRGRLGFDSGRICCWGKRPKPVGSLCSTDAPPPPAPGIKCSKTCGAWSPRPAPGGLAGPGQIVPGEAPGAAGSELRAAGRLGVGGGQGRVPDVGVADPGTLWPLLQRAPGGPPRVAVLVGWELVFQRCNMDTSCSPLLLGPWLSVPLPGR